MLHITKCPGRGSRLDSKVIIRHLRKQTEGYTCMLRTNDVHSVRKFFWRHKIFKKETKRIPVFTQKGDQRRPNSAGKGDLYWDSSTGKRILMHQSLLIFASFLTHMFTHTHPANLQLHKQTDTHPHTDIQTCRQENTGRGTTDSPKLMNISR